MDFRTNLHITSARFLAAAVSTRHRFGAKSPHRFTIFFAVFFCLLAGLGPVTVSAQISSLAGAGTNETFHFDVTAYVVNDNSVLPTNDWTTVLSKHTGTNLNVYEIIKAAADLQGQYRELGYPMTSIAVGQGEITNGIVTLNVFQTAVPQIVFSGVRYNCSTNGEVTAYLPPAAPAVISPTPPVPTNAIENPLTATIVPAKPVSAADLAQARTNLIQQMIAMDTEKVDNRIHVVSTNAGPHFEVERYRITGNTLLSPQQLAMVLTNIDGDYGTNVTVEGIQTVVKEMQKSYQDRGYVTVAVGLPQQKLTNATVKVQVTEGRLTEIDVEGNHYFSSNNVMRALPSLHTNIILNGNVLQAELNRANASRDRQIYPVITPGPYPGTSVLALHVKDQLPLHAKLEFNNQSTPGTPQLRVNASAVEDNLWQREHSLGVQYGFTPENYKMGNQWDFYDLPLVANYSTFYRMPLGSPQSVETLIENNPGSFGYDEATHQFNLPPPSGQTELNLYASRSTIDTGLETLLNETLLDVPDVRVLSRVETQEGLTINGDYGFQLSQPVPVSDSVPGVLSGGLDYKTFHQENFQTNLFTDSEFTENSNHKLTERTLFIFVPTPGTVQNVNYLPLTLSYNGNANDALGPATFGISFSANLWYTSEIVTTNVVKSVKRESLDEITGSTKSTGHWVVIKPSFSQSIVTENNWTTVMRADGQWASEPLISNEQFGIGGVNSVRGYHEGEIFGDTGWHVTLEEDTPPHIAGMAHGQALTLQGLFYTDLATAYLLDPQGRQPSTKLWGTGIGVDASLGTHWQAQFLFSLPLISTSLIERYNPYFNFSLTAQF